PAFPAGCRGDRRGRMDPTRHQCPRCCRSALPGQPCRGSRSGARSAEPARMIPLQSVALALVGLGALAVVTTRDPLRQTLVAGLYGLALAVLFVVLQAPDVALSEIVVSSVATPFILLTALAKMRGRPRKRAAARASSCSERP